MSDMPSASPRAALLSYRLSGEASSRSELPRVLDEISGLAASPDGRLFSHDDERGIVYELDARTGEIVRHFELGRGFVLEDFEGLAFAEGYFYLTTSDGTLFRFEEGKDREQMEYQVYESGLASRHDVEGLCYDPATRCLLLACKGWAGRDRKGFRAVFAWDIDAETLRSEPRFLLEERALAGKHGRFSPSGIEYNAQSGTFFLLSSKDAAIAEIDSAGHVLAVRVLRDSHHPQPEGIAVLPDGRLVIADEGAGRSARLTVYHAEKVVREP